MVDLFPRRGGRRFLLTLGLAILGAGLVTTEAEAELIVGLTTDNRLTTFDSATPGAASTPIAITGLEAGDSIVGIDRRPSVGPNNGLLYALGIQGGIGRLYTINEVTGVASMVFQLSQAVIGTTFGVDFNPVVDRLRVVSNADQNLRINVDNGVTLVDGTLAYASGDVNFGEDPTIVGAAYSNNFGGAPSTTLRDLDSGLEILATQAPPNAGTLNTQFGLGVNFLVESGYDISGVSGTPFASLNVAGETTTGFYTLSPGGASLVGNIETPGGPDFVIRDIAAQVGAPVPEPSSLALMGIGGACLFGYAWRRRRPAIRSAVQ